MCEIHFLFRIEARLMIRSCSKWVGRCSRFILCADGGLACVLIFNLRCLVLWLVGSIGVIEGICAPHLLCLCPCAACLLG